MTRTNRGSEPVFDPEIERTLRRLRHRAKNLEQIAASSTSTANMEEIRNQNANQNLEVRRDQPVQVDPQNRNRNIPAEEVTMRQHGVVRPINSPLCIVRNNRFPFELKTGLLQTLPKFSRQEVEDANRFLRSFKYTCSGYQPQQAILEDVSLKAFPFALEGAAKDWLYYLPPGSIATWEDMENAFLKRYFPPYKAKAAKRSITTVKQGDAENLYEYWDRFNKLCESYPQHNLSDYDLLEHFYDGMKEYDRDKVDSACGGSILDKTPTAIREAIQKVAENSMRFPKRQTPCEKSTNSSMDRKIDELTILVKSQLLNQGQTQKVCGLCFTPGHYADQCPTVADNE